MAEQWHANWHKLNCPNGHELKSYDSIMWSADLRWYTVYAICDECGTPCVFKGEHDLTLDNAAPDRVMLAQDNDKPVDLPPFKFPDGNDFNKG